METWLRRIRNGSFVVLVALMLGSSSTLVRAYDTCNGPNYAGVNVFTWYECFWWSYVSEEDVCDEMLVECNSVCQTNGYAYGVEYYSVGCHPQHSAGPITYLAHYACECIPW